MIYFTKDYIDFFKELAANNHKQWFDENRKRYEITVREPFKIFVADLLHEIQRIDTDNHLEPKDAILRINRDIRFSKDKTPYRLFNAAILAKYGRKDKSYPGMYIEFNPEKLAVLGGVYGANREQIHKIRNAIVTNSKYFENLISNPDFLRTYGTIKGEKNIRIPKEFIDAAKEQPLLYHKRWYYEANLPVKTLYADDLMDKLISLYKISHDLQDFFIEALLQ